MVRLAILGLVAMLALVAGRSAAAAEFSLYEAAKAGDRERVRQLLADGAEVDLPEHLDTALHAAAMGGSASVAALLLAAGADIERIGMLGTPIHVAATAGAIDVVKLLVAQGADVDAMDMDCGRTALHYAVEAGDEVLLRHLLVAGANPNTTAVTGETPLDIALLNSNSAAVALLRRHGANE